MTDDKLATIEWATLVKSLKDSMQRGLVWEVVRPQKISAQNEKAFDYVLRHTEAGELRLMIQTILIHGCALCDTYLQDLPHKAPLEEILDFLHLRLCQKYPESLMH